MRIPAPTHIRTPEDLQFLNAPLLGQDRLDIDLTDVEWISPLGVVAVLASCLRASRDELSATVHPPQKADVSDYLVQIGFVAELERNGWTGPEARGTADPAGIRPHLPVSRLTNDGEVRDASDALGDALTKAGLAGSFSDGLSTITTELSSNAREHGADCYAVAQIHSGKRSGTPGVHIAIADFGEGFASTLREHHGEMPDSEAIIQGFEAGVSGTGGRLRGQGLAYVAETVDTYRDNELHIVSQSGYVVRRGGAFRVIEGIEFQGTLAAAYLPTPPDLL